MIVFIFLGEARRFVFSIFTDSFRCQNDYFISSWFTLQDYSVCHVRFPHLQATQVDSLTPHSDRILTLILANMQHQVSEARVATHHIKGVPHILFLLRVHSLFPFLRQLVFRKSLL